MVICIGIPFPNFNDDKIRFKKQYLNNKGKNKNINGYNNLGDKWYEADAMINVNQALGRVIRNKDDYGVMICIDERYILKSIKNLFSNWFSKNLEIKSLKENDELYMELNKFYDICKKNYSKKNLNFNKNENNDIKLIGLFNNIFVNNDLNCCKIDNKDNNLSKKRRRFNDEFDEFFLFKSSIEEESEENESIDNNNIDKELFDLINKTPNFNKKQFDKLQNNENKEYKKKLKNVLYALPEIVKVIF